MTAADTSIETTPEADQRDEAPCEASKHCAHAATWRATVLCPVTRHTWLFCDEHRAKELALLERPGPNVCLLHRDATIPAPFIEWRHL